MAQASAQRTRVDGALGDALGEIADGAVVGIGGTLTAGRPMALVRELIRRRPKDLTLVAPIASLDVDLAIAAGCVRRVVTAYVGAEAVAAVAPAFRAAAERGDVEVVDLDEAHCVVGLRAAGQRLPFLPWLGGVGTDLPTVNPALVEFEDPISGRPLLAVPAIELDVALIHTETADAYGNVQFAGTGHMDALIASAAKRVVVQAERIVSTDRMRRNPGATHYWRDTSVTRTPWGTHPYASASIETDAEHLAGYAKAARSAARGEGSDLEAYLEAYVFSPDDHADYLDAVGIRRIAGLLT
jgi:glutaconate CoA-transferase subunit A